MVHFKTRWIDFLWSPKGFYDPREDVDRPKMLRMRLGNWIYSEAKGWRKA